VIKSVRIARAGLPGCVPGDGPDNMKNRFSGGPDGLA